MKTPTPMAQVLREEARAIPFVLMVFFALFYGGSGVDALRWAYDEFILPRPWVNPVLEVRDVGTDRPAILYGARAAVPVSGRWVASIDVGGFRLESNDGDGSYRVGTPPRLWSWQDFFDMDVEEPNVPYKVCVFYDLTTSSGAQDITPTFCSPEFDPRKAE